MIDIVVSNGVPHVWSPADWYALRTVHRIIGYFDGALPETASTGSQLPIRLTKLETQYLVKSGIARTVECPKLSSFKAPVSQEKFLELREERVNQEMVEYKKRKRVTMEDMIDNIIERKMKTLRGRSTMGVIPDRNAVIQDEMAKITKLPFVNITIDLKDPWTTPEDYIPLEFPLPSTSSDILRFRVFEDLHLRRKYYLTPGCKFGGDFLAYPGDPNNYHAEYIILCEEKDRKLPWTLVATQERLTQSVKKTLLIATLDEDLDVLKYRCGRRHHRLLLKYR